MSQPKTIDIVGRLYIPAVTVVDLTGTSATRATETGGNLASINSLLTPALDVAAITTASQIYVNAQGYKTH